MNRNALFTLPKFDMDDLIIRAARLAKEAHEGQMRKYRPRPYILHPARVAARTTLLSDVTAEEIAAAWLHDVLEDTSWTEHDLLKKGIPARAVQIVLELTNPSKQHPELPRPQRKQMDFAHLRDISLEAKRIKLIDRTDNLRDIQDASRAFQSLYVAESVMLAEHLSGTSEELEEELFGVVEELGFTRHHRDSRTE